MFWYDPTQLGCEKVNFFPVAGLPTRATVNIPTYRFGDALISRSCIVLYTYEYRASNGCFPRLKCPNVTALDTQVFESL